MNKEERIKLVFETLSKIVGFEIKPNKEFYMIGYGLNDIYLIDEFLDLHYKNHYGYFVPSEFNILPIFNGWYRFEEIKEPLLTEKEKDFLRHFNFKELEISNNLYMYNKTDLIVNCIDLNTINYGFGGLQKGKKYSRKELGL